MQLLPPKIVEREEEAQKELYRLADFEDHKLESVKGVYRELWARYLEMVNKLNLIYAISENPERPIITKQAVEYSAEFVKLSIEHVIASLRGCTSRDGDINASIYDIIKAAGPDGIKRYEIMRKGRYSAKDLTPVLSDLCEMRHIRCAISPTQGRPSEIYYA